MQSFEAASKLYFDGLTTVVSLYDKVDAAGKDNLLQLFESHAGGISPGSVEFPGLDTRLQIAHRGKQRGLT